MFTCLQAAQLKRKETVLKSNVLSQPTINPYWRISDPPSGVLEGNNGGTAVVQSEELSGNLRGTRLGGIGKHRGNSWEEWWKGSGAMRFPVHSPCPLLGGTAGTVKESWGNCKDSFA